MCSGRNRRRTKVSFETMIIRRKACVFFWQRLTSSNRPQSVFREAVEAGHKVAIDATEAVQLKALAFRLALTD